MKIVATNRTARHNYLILETYEAGMVLEGCEVKSLRAGGASLRDSFARFERGEIYLDNCHISPYVHARNDGYNPTRKRKLLLHNAEIKKLLGKVSERRLTLIPLRIYFKAGKAKVELALARGKRLYDKREELKRRAARREVEQALKGK